MVVADVSGKGVPASLVMSMLRTVIQIYARQIVSPKEIIVAVNDYMKINIPPGMFVTVFLLMYDGVENSIQYVSAGHNPMIYYNSSKKIIEELNPKGMPVGLPTKEKDKFDNSIIEEKRVMQSNDCFFVYTDGITEAPDRDGKLFGVERLKEFLKKHLQNNSTTMKKLSASLVDEIDDYTGFHKAADDISYIIVRKSEGIVKNKAEESEEKSVSFSIKNISDVDSNSESQ